MPEATNLQFQTTFTVYPEDTNYMHTLFGGKLMKEMDVCAGMTAKRALYDSKCSRAVTAHVDDLDFTVPGNVGDIIFLTGTIVELGNKSISIDVQARKETNQNEQKIDMCNARFVFVAMQQGEPHPHGLTLPK